MAQVRKWKGIEVPPNVCDALETPWRGQTTPNLTGTSSKLIMDFWKDEARLIAQATIVSAESVSSQLTRERNVTSFLVLKDDPDVTRGPYKYNAINPTRLVKPILQSVKISNERKATLCRKLNNKEANAWLADHQHDEETAASPHGKAEAAVAHDLKSDADKAADERAGALKARMVQRLSTAQCEALMYAVAVFFFVCRIPFSVVQHWAFVSMITALSPAFSEYLRKRKCLSSTWLDKLYGDTTEKVTQRLNAAPGKNTVVIDGFKDRRGRHVMNISTVKVGIPVYKHTEWFGIRSHSGAVYGKAAEEVIEDSGEDRTIAVCADNTSSNTGMQKGLFGYLSRLPDLSLFLIGCCVHCVNLLSEDVSKLPEIVAVLGKYKFIIKFILRFSLLHETFLAQQKARKREDRGSSMMGLKMFPDTRFAYAFLMIHSVFVNWFVVSNLPQTQEFKLLKRHATTKQKPDFRLFEDLVGSSETMRQGEAAVGVLRPISSSLHYLEGDSVPPSHVLPVFVLSHQNAQHPPAEVSEQFESSTTDAVAKCFKDRWLGDGRKVGIRHDVHCLAYHIDVYTRSIIKHALKDSVNNMIEASYPESALNAALKTYCGKDEAKYATLLTEMQSFNAGSGGYKTKLETADAAVKLKVAHLLQGSVEGIDPIDADTKESPILLALALFRRQDHIGHSVTMWQDLAKSAATPPNVRVFAEMCVVILQIIAQACSVERVNKGHGLVHSKARASMGNANTKKALFVFTNEELMAKLDRDATDPKRFASFESFLGSNLDDSEAQDILGRLNATTVSTDEYLPAEDSSQRRNAQPQSTSRRQGAGNEEEALSSASSDSNSDEDEEMTEESDVIYFDTFEIPDGFRLITLDAPPTFISAKEVETRALYMLLCTDDLSWMFGRITKYKPRATKFNFDVIWSGDDEEHQGVKLSNYYSVGEAALSGRWVYLEKTGSERRAREEAKEGSEGESEEPSPSRPRAGAAEHKAD